MAKLSVLLSEFMSRCDPPDKLDLNTYERYLHSLEEWSSSLPQSLKYFPKTSDSVRQSTLSIEDEFSSVSTSFARLVV